VIDYLHGLIFEGFLPVFMELFHHLPTVVVLLTVVSFFENSGLMLGFSCTTLAVGSVEKEKGNLHCERSCRFLTFVPCAAKAPVLLFLLVLIGLDGLRVFVVIALYGLAICLGLLLGGHHVVRCPRLKKVTLKEFVINVLRHTLEFVKRISVGLLLAVAVLYTLQYLGWLLPIATVIEPLFAPVGFSAPLIVALLFGLVAKEMIIAVILSFGVAGLGLTAASAMSFVVFVLLYTTCLPSLIAIKSKIGLGGAARIALINFMVAYSVSLVVYNVAVLF